MALPSIGLTLLNLPTKEIVEKLESGEIDLGVVRSDAISARLKGKSLGKMDFALFAPKKLIKKPNADTRSVLSACSIAVLEGSGAFRVALQQAAAAEGCRLRIEIECSSFPAVAKALTHGGLAAILPIAAKEELQEPEFIPILAPWLHKLSRNLSLAWNPRTCQIRRELPTVYNHLSKIWSL
jgi:DNA-binding transcriptional LysR family regulator